MIVTEMRAGVNSDTDPLGYQGDAPETGAASERVAGWRPETGAASEGVTCCQPGLPGTW
jgi:hypothetical protein